MITGDLVVELQQQSHPLFRREGVNLFMKKKITLSQALVSTEYSFACV